ncbi:C10 family peptidase [Emticicia sp. 21SJ11W-3]|uniref:C10 family peptidase n=1 Tax=Emticicia sp. 21SJ11W-3 TaxID=2916755 RepID=UPI0020A1D5C1|nr:C10 family peptidase [Emticicia sp. 21SJ11W-3]UTA68376.1 C10 family peptidase [Emticicia sp. 21SJ11W-3]
MDYQCTGSAAATYDGYLSFKNDYGYSSAQYDNYNYQTVISNLDNLHPVVLAGGKYSGWWIFATYDSGHALVTDGYHTYNFCESGTYLYLHMNWGREGSQDGFYAYDYWSPPYHYYESSKEMIYNLY